MIEFSLFLGESKAKFLSLPELCEFRNILQNVLDLILQVKSQAAWKCFKSSLFKCEFMCRNNRGCVGCYFCFLKNASVSRFFELREQRWGYHQPFLTHNLAWSVI